MTMVKMHAKRTIVTRIRPARVPTLGQMNKCLAAVITTLSYTLAQSCKRLLHDSEIFQKSFSGRKGQPQHWRRLIEAVPLRSGLRLATRGRAQPQVFFSPPGK